MATPGLVRPLPDADLMPEELRAAIVLFASLLDERQRRLFAGLEALKCGGAATDASPRCSASTRPPSRRDDDNSSSTTSRWTGCDAPVAGARQRKKNTGSHRPARSPDGARDGRRPRHRLEVDTPYDRQGRGRVAQARHRRLPADRRSTPQGDGIFAARQPQEARRRLAPGPQRPVRAHHRTAQALRRREHPPHQRRYEEEGARRRVQEPRREVGPHPTTPPNSSRTTTFAPRPKASPSPTASTTRGRTPAPSSSARAPTPRRSPSTASRSGGAPRAASAIPTPRRCRSSPTAAAATAARRGPGSSTCNIGSATVTACG